MTRITKSLRQRIEQLGRLPLWRVLFNSSWSASLMAITSGVLGGFSFPGGLLPAAWVLVYIPLFIGLDIQLRRLSPQARRWPWVLWLCWQAGLFQGILSGAWVVNTAHVYGHLPLWMATGVSWLGLGSLFGVELFFFLGLPFLLFWQRPLWGFFILPLWSAVFQAWVPRFFYWTYGQHLYPVPVFAQMADLVGSAGLNFWIIGLHLLGYGLWRRAFFPQEIQGQWIRKGALGITSLFVVSAVYGGVRMAMIESATESGAPIQIAAVQPNFSLGYLASNPALSHSDRRSNLNALLADTQQALEELTRDDSAPILTVWPESVFPIPYFRDDRIRQAIEWWVQERDMHLVLTSTTETRTQQGGRPRRNVFGSALHIRPDGNPPGIYNKIALIPFGETIPFADWIPGYRAILKAWIPQISEFAAGEEHTVFSVSPEIRVAPMICFDAVRDGVALGMTRNGANFGLVLANLAWFGETNISELFEFFVQFRAIENRIPILLLSQNGTSVLFDGNGNYASRRLEVFQQDRLAIQTRIPDTFSFFAQFGWLIYTLYGAALLVSLYAYRYGLPQSGLPHHIASKPSQRKPIATPGKKAKPRKKPSPGKKK